MQDYEFTVTHRPGVKHQNADHLSRYPRESREGPSVARLDDDEEECCDVTTGPAGVVASACEMSPVMSMFAFVASSIEATLGSAMSASSVISIPSASELYGHYHPYHQGMTEPPC